MSNLREVCEELDRVLVEIMTTLDVLSSLRAKYSAAVTEGYFYMSQARHAMGGPSSVSALQYDARMSALVHTHCTVELDSYDQLVSSKGELDIEFQIDRNNSSKKQVERIAETSGESQLRRRNVDKGSVEDVPLSLQQKVGSRVEKDVQESKTKDSLKWFGVLVPPYLRRSQDQFKQAVLLAGELAGAQLRLEVLRRRFRHLLKTKSELKSIENEELADHYHEEPAC